MTLLDGILIVLAGTGPYILAIAFALCLLVYGKTKSRFWMILIAIVTLILLIPSIVYFWARMSNGL